MNQKKITPLIREIDNKSIVWFPKSNQYVVMETYDADILLKLYNKESSKDIADWLKQKVNLLDEDITKHLSSIQQLKILQDSFTEKDSIQFLKLDKRAIHSTIYKRYYEISGKIFCAEYENFIIEALIHPKFSHLETDCNEKINYTIRVFSEGDEYLLFADDEFLGQWNQDNIHFLTGKFSMVLLSKMYNRPENKWLAVLHASAVTDGKSCLLFAGHSGDGKSTCAALMMANGYRLLADDFVPLDTDHKICLFPAALSVKKNAINMLSDKFPELGNSKEYKNPQSNKIIKYVSPTQNMSKQVYSAKALIFIKYDKNVSIRVEKISTVGMLIRLIPDTWISSLQENVLLFLNWISELPCYMVTYSDNKKMIKEMKSIFIQ